MTSRTAADPALVLHITDATYSGCRAIDADTLSCSEIVVEGDAASPQFVFVLSSGVGDLALAQFGIEYDPTVNVSSWALCTDGMSIEETSWPDSGTAIAVTWQEPAEPTGSDGLVSIGFFSIASGSSGTIRVTPDRRIGDAIHIGSDLVETPYHPSLLGIADVNGNEEGVNTCGAEPSESAGGGESGTQFPTGGAFQGDSAPTKTAFVWFRSNVASTTGGETTISSENVATALTMYDVQTVSPVSEDYPIGEFATARTGERVRLANFSGLYYVEILDQSDMDDFVEAIGDLPEVRWAEPVRQPLPVSYAAPNDSLFQRGRLWNLYNAGQIVYGHTADFVGVMDADIDAPEAWSIEQGDSSIIVAVFDSGFKGGHPDFSGRLHADSDTTLDGDCHGYSVAGVIGATTNNSAGIAGVDWNATLLSKQVLGTGAGAKHTKIYESLEAGASVGNHSYTQRRRFDPALRLAFRDAYQLNTVQVVAMSNNNYCKNPTSGLPEDPNYPAAFDIGVVSVGNVNFHDKYKEPWWPGDCYGEWMDVSAPGREVLTIWGEAECDTYPTSFYEERSGTSLAAPHVAGIVSLMLAHDPTLYNDDIENLLRWSADDIVSDDAGSGYDVYTGWGRVSAYSALLMLDFPYGLVRDQVVGGSVFHSTSHYTVDFYGGVGPKDVVRKEVRATVSLPDTFDIVSVWGRGVAEGSGYGPDEPRWPTESEFDYPLNFRQGWCELVPGSLSGTSATLRTFVFDLYENGSYVGTIPTTPDSVVFAYTTFGYSSTVSVSDAAGPQDGLALSVNRLPMNDTVLLHVSLPHDDKARVSVFDVSGRLVRRLHAGPLPAGRHRFVWDAGDRYGRRAAVGVYFVELRAGGKSVSERVLLLR